jgi:hypothetical protein
MAIGSAGPSTGYLFRTLSENDLFGWRVSYNPITYLGVPLTTVSDYMAKVTQKYEADFNKDFYFLLDMREPEDGIPGGSIGLLFNPVQIKSSFRVVIENEDGTMSEDGYQTFQKAWIRYCLLYTNKVKLC